MFYIDRTSSFEEDKFFLNFMTLNFELWVMRPLQPRTNSESFDICRLMLSV